MNRRNFLTTMGGATAAAASLTPLAFAAETTRAFYVKGLLMMSFEDESVLRLGLPKAPGHKGTLSMVPENGAPKVVNLKGNYALQTTKTVSRQPDYKIPELIRMQEIYGNAIHSKIQECPTVISIPYAAIRSITATEVSPTRYTFVRADNGQEITSFRPRKVAETLKIELSSDAVMKLDRKKTIAMGEMREFHTEYVPEHPTALAGMDAFTAHFPHYNAYLVRPPEANFDVLPKNLGPASTATPKVGNHLVRFWPYYVCFVVSF